MVGRWETVGWKMDTVSSKQMAKVTSKLVLILRPAAVTTKFIVIAGSIGILLRILPPCQ